MVRTVAAKREGTACISALTGEVGGKAPLFQGKTLPLCRASSFHHLPAFFEGTRVAHPTICQLLPVPHSSAAMVPVSSAPCFAPFLQLETGDTPAHYSFLCCCSCSGCCSAVVVSLGGRIDAFWEKHRGILQFHPAICSWQLCLCFCAAPQGVPELLQRVSGMLQSTMVDVHVLIPYSQASVSLWPCSPWKLKGHGANHRCLRGRKNRSWS